MARGRSWGRVSALLSIAGGAVLLLLVLANQRPLAETEKPPVVSEQNEPEPLDRAETPAAEPVALAAVSLPPPPAPKSPEPVPEAKAPDQPAVKIEPLRPEPPKPEPEPVQTIKPLKAEAVQPKPVEAPEPEPVHVIKPLKAEAPKPAPVEPPEPVKPLAGEVKAEPENDPIKPLRPKPPEPRPQPVEEEKIVEAPPPVEPLRPQPWPQPLTAKAAPETAPQPQPQPETVQLSVDTTGKVAQEGRALLRLLEHGSGPTIEIGWPRDSRERQHLYRTLAGCFGMKPILMDGSGNLYTQEGARGHKWEINLDRFSGFVRQPAGFVAPEERGGGRGDSEVSRPSLRDDHRADLPAPGRRRPSGRAPADSGGRLPEGRRHPRNLSSDWRHSLCREHRRRRRSGRRADCLRQSATVQHLGRMAMDWRRRGWIALVGGSLMTAACTQTSYSPYGKSSDPLNPLERTIEFQVADAFYDDPPRCAIVLPFAGKAAGNARPESIERSLARQLSVRLGRVIGPLERGRLVRELAVDLSQPSDLKHFARATRCPFLISAKPWGEGSVFALVWTQERVGVEVEMTRARDDALIWKARHIATRSEGGLPLSPFSALFNAMTVGHFKTDADVPNSLIEDATRRIAETLPDTRTYGLAARRTR